MLRYGLNKQLPAATSWAGLVLRYGLDKQKSTLLTLKVGGMGFLLVQILVVSSVKEKETPKP